MPRCLIVRLKSNALLVLLLASLFLIGRPSLAASDIWEKINPGALNGTISAISAMDNYIYLATSQGIYKSADYGQTWNLINSGLTNFGISSIAIGWTYSTGYVADANTPVYLGTADGVFKSVLGSTTWSQLPGTDDLVVTNLKIDQFKGTGADPSTLYLATQSNGGLYRSDDEGATWSIQNSGLEGEVAKNLVTDWNGGNIYVLLDSNKLAYSPMFSVDSLTNENYFVSLATSTVLNRVSMNNSFGGIIYLATANGILKSTDAGTTWLGINTGLADQRINAVASDYNGYFIALAASQSGAYLSISNDGATLGDSWSNANLGMGNAALQGIVTNPATSSYAYAFSTTSVYRLIFSDIATSSADFLRVTDIISPAPITTLATNSVSTSSIALNWTTVGDDLDVGTTTAYDIRYSTSTIDEANWNIASRLADEPTPAGSGGNDTMTVHGLLPATEYFFAIKVADEAFNESSVSNVLSISTLPTTPVGFSATTVSATGINLSWSTTTEALDYYIIYRGGAEIATTSSASYADSGLTASTQYVYALKSLAISGGTSASAIATATTQAAVVSQPSGVGGGSVIITCTSWTYSAWSSCSGGNQSRTIVTSLPSSCSGGAPILKQACVNVASSTGLIASSTGLPDSGPVITISVNTATSLTDSDNDGLIDDLEKALGTNPLKADTDNDGFSDKEELQKGYSPLSARKSLSIDATLAKKIQGKIFLQIENKGQAWYINPADLKRYYLGRPADAFAVMRKQGLGVKHEVITRNKTYPTRLLGRILIDTGDKGRAYYINPQDKKAYYLGRPADAFGVMRKAGTGITDLTLNKVAVGL